MSDLHKRDISEILTRKEKYSKSDDAVLESKRRSKTRNEMYTYGRKQCDRGYMRVINKS